MYVCRLLGHFGYGNLGTHSEIIPNRYALQIAKNQQDPLCGFKFHATFFLVQKFEFQL